MLNKSSICILLLIVVSLFAGFSLATTENHHQHHQQQQPETVEIQAEHAQVYFLSKNVAVDFSVECSGCDVLVTDEVDNVLAAKPYNVDRQLSSLSVEGAFARTGVKSTVDRVLVMRNPSQTRTLKITYLVKEHTNAAAASDDASVYVIGFAVGICVVALLALAVFLVTSNNNRKATASRCIIPETVQAARPQISYGTYTTSAVGVPSAATLSSIVSSNGSSASPMVPPVYFVYPVPPRYPQVNSNNTAAAQPAAEDEITTTTTAPAVQAQKLYPALHPAAAGTRRAVPI